MLGINWISFIIPNWSIFEVVYVLLIVNYFLKFIRAKDYLKHMVNKVVDIYKNHISLIFGHNKAIYLDNGFHFVNQKVQDYFQK